MQEKEEGNANKGPRVIEWLTQTGFLLTGKREIKPARNEAVSADYLSDFALGEENTDADEEEEDEEPPPQSKAWGKITELFPPRSGGKDDKDGLPKDTILPLGKLAFFNFF